MKATITVANIQTNDIAPNFKTIHNFSNIITYIQPRISSINLQVPISLSSHSVHQLELIATVSQDRIAIVGLRA